MYDTCNNVGDELCLCFSCLLHQSFHFFFESSPNLSLEFILFLKSFLKCWVQMGERSFSRLSIAYSRNLATPVHFPVSPPALLLLFVPPPPLGRPQAPSSLASTSVLLSAPSVDEATYFPSYDFVTALASSLHPWLQLGLDTNTSSLGVSTSTRGAFLCSQHS